MKTLILSLLMLFAIQGYSQTATLTARTLTPLQLVNDEWKTGNNTDCSLTVELSTDNVKVFNSQGEIILNTAIVLEDLVEDYETKTYQFTVPTESSATVQYLFYKQNYQRGNVVALLWVSSRSSGKGVILELSLCVNNELISGLE